MDASGEKLASDGTMGVKFIDTEQEKKIDAGVSWPFNKLKQDECIINAKFASKNVNVGDQVTVRIINDKAFWDNIYLNEYSDAAFANGWPRMNRMSLLLESEVPRIAVVTEFPCTVKAMISETYGKMPEAGAD